jgi:UrcA family protein
MFRAIRRFAMPRFMNMKTAMQCTLLAMSLSSLSAVAATIVPDDEVPARTVKFADLNLTRNEGAAVLYARISAAAREVCLPASTWVPQLLFRAYRCREEAIARAVADVNAPVLTSYYLAKAKPTMEQR